MQQALRTAIYKVTHSSIQFQSKQLKCYTGTGAKINKTKTPETNCKVPSNLKIILEFTKPKLLFLSKS